MDVRIKQLAIIIALLNNNKIVSSTILGQLILGRQIKILLTSRLDIHK